ncbi:hypothetical protein ACXC9Q_11555 [Kribbella sp. CWNU-51]
MSAPATEQPLRRVCVWFGEHLVIDHVSDPDYAARFEDAMRRRFASLRVTNEEATDQ